MNLQIPTNPLLPQRNLATPRPPRVCFPVLLSGDLVMSSEHLGVSYLCSILKDAGAECKIIEVPFSHDSNTPEIDEIVEWEPDVIGLSLTTITVAHATQLGTALRKRLGQDVYFIAGGALATFLSKELLTNKNWGFLNGLIRGEGDIPIVRFVEAFWGEGDYTTVPNLTWKNTDGTIQENPIALPLENLDLLPEPSRAQFECNNHRMPYLRIATSRGCSGRCTFCNAPHAGNKTAPGKLWRAQSPEKVVEGVEHLYNTYNVNTFDFVDSTFEDPGGASFAKERIRKIAEGFINKNMRVYYNVCMQAKNWSSADKDLIDTLYESGLEKVLIGVESSTQGGLDIWKKRSNVEDNERAITLLRGAGIYVAFGFISFHPWSTFDEIRNNNIFLKNMMGYNLRRFTVRLEMYPGAEVISKLKSEGMLESDFEETLNPLAYRFHDPRIGRLADATSLLYGSMYKEEGVIEKQPSVFEFETYDIVLHTYMSRLKRHCRADQAAMDVILASEEKADGIRDEMVAFNFDLISIFVDKAESETLDDAFALAQAPIVEAYYREQMDRLRTLQLQTSFKLHRQGVSVNEITFSGASKS